MSTRTTVGLKCGCERRMPKGTAMQRLKDKEEVNCAQHGKTTVLTVTGPPSLSNLLRF